MLIIGLTGSIGMGKSTTAALFRAFGVPVHDSDRAVHDLYRGDANDEIAFAFPAAMNNGGVDRQLLATQVLANPQALRRLEAIIHPRVSAHRLAFVRACKQAGARLVICDIPLLFETGADRDCDLVVVVSASTPVQKARVLARPGMTPERFDAIVAKQMADAEKRRRAHIVIDTGRGIVAAQRQVAEFLRATSAVRGHAFKG
ncbi:MAG: dephospho-CoA kinase [Hyphomicrobiales bacterium]|nr:dephospho-CoA kinase [Hyphomicrobiales bacterium]